MNRPAYQPSIYRSYSGAANDERDGEINHERWLVSYADFMTLLMAFFVVMYSISQISEQKYRVLSETFTQAFNPTSKSEIVFQEGDPQLSHTLTPIDMEGHALQESPGNDANDVPETFVRIEEQLSQSYQTLIENDLITVTGDERWLQIELQSAILFSSGGAVLNEVAESIIGELTATMLEHKNVIRVEGFTDDVPIQTPIFGSNWELSTARATAVVRLMEEQGVDPSRLAAVGYGEHQPAASNNTEEGRARNRRIVLMVSTSEQLRPDAEQVEELEIDTGRFEDAGGEGLISGLDVSAQAQAEAWFARLNVAQADAISNAAEQAGDSQITEVLENQITNPAASELVNTLPLLPNTTDEQSSPSVETEQQAEDSSGLDIQIDPLIPMQTPQELETNPENRTRETVEGVKQVQLENGAILFTSDQ